VKGSGRDPPERRWPHNAMPAINRGQLILMLLFPPYIPPSSYPILSAPTPSSSPPAPTRQHDLDRIVSVTAGPALLGHGPRLHIGVRCK